MQNILKALRYLIFGIFIICNAIVASVTVWNHSLAQPMKWNSGVQIDLYLIFLGCFGLALIFTTIFVELACKNPITGQVWFECTWVGLFWALYLAGAVAISVTVPSEICKQQVSAISTNDLCTSTRVMLAFSWTNTVILLFYFLLLVVASLIHLKHDSRIWHRYVYKFPWSDFRRSTSSAPPSPSLPRFLKKMPSIVAPKPRRAAPSALYNYRSGLSSEYEIEHYHPPSRPPSRPPSTSMNFPFLPMPAATHPFNPARMARQTTNKPSISFYPQYMQSALVPTPQPPDMYSPQHPIRPPSPPSPSPIGDWPRPNAVMQPLRSKRDRLPQSSTSAGAPHTETTLRPRPSGPRRKLGAAGDPRLPAQDISSGSHGPPAGR